MSGHTKGPWKQSRDSGGVPYGAITNADGSTLIATLGYNVRVGSTEDDDNAARIVACVNACEGIDPEAVPDLLKALEGLLGRHRCLGCGPLGGKHGSGCASAIAEAALALARGGK